MLSYPVYSWVQPQSDAIADTERKMVAIQVTFSCLTGLVWQKLQWEKRPVPVRYALL